MVSGIFFGPWIALLMALGWASWHYSHRRWLWGTLFILIGLFGVLNWAYPA